MNADLIELIETSLPQTQCTRCGYADCHAYAVAIATEGTPINQCPPGGQQGVDELARLLNLDAIPLNPKFGIEAPRRTAVIDEPRCIGCTLCIQACPLDAIVGSGKRMHTVLTAFCSGCDLCVEPCPVDCIDMVELETLAAQGHSEAGRVLDYSPQELRPVFRRRYANHQQRVQAQHQEREQQLVQKGSGKKPNEDGQSARPENHKKAAIIAGALRRARARQGVNK